MARLIDAGPGCPTPTPLRGTSVADETGLAYNDAVKAKPDDLYPLVSDFIISLAFLCKSAQPSTQPYPSNGHMH